MRSSLERIRYALASALGLAILLGVVAWVLAAARPERFEATVRLVVAPGANLDDDPDAGLYAADVLSRQTVTATLAEILSSSNVQRTAAAAIDVTRGDLDRYTLAAAAAPQANLVTVTVGGPDPATTARLADSLGATGAQRFIELYELYQVAVVESADRPVDPVGFTPLQLALVGAIAGAVIGGLVGSRIDDARRRRHTASVDP